MKINLKEGFKRITLTICLITTILLIIFSFFYIPHKSHSDISKNIKFKDIKTGQIEVLEYILPESYIEINKINDKGRIYIRNLDAYFKIIDILKDKKSYWDIIPAVENPNTYSERSYVDIVAFAKNLNLKILNNDLPTRIGCYSKQISLFILLIFIVNICIYGSYLLFVWICSGFKENIK